MVRDFEVDDVNFLYGSERKSVIGFGFLVSWCNLRRRVFKNQLKGLYVSYKYYICNINSNFILVARGSSSIRFIH